MRDFIVEQTGIHPSLIDVSPLPDYASTFELSTFEESVDFMITY
ncbi:hypothetical protein [Herbiconiux daphne]|uniref:Uncharacterized protein n=1 Tax=Herbiconiux daphne TaxID=2970914 RepID=A0ABT2H753_9MICO|nr:hypothetical protein [Herbiconiux daphne]MCS5735739.1 hypothetical protein [Herbiconiux daphne]